MSTTVIAFFNNKGGVGKTSLVYHLAWMYAELGTRVVAADLDPQANLTAAFLDEDRLEDLWPDSNHPQTVFGCVQPLLQGTGDIAIPHLEDIEDRLALLVGDLALSGFEDELSDVWPKCLDSHPRAFRVISAFWRLMQNAASMHDAEVILMDLGPNLGALTVPHSSLRITLPYRLRLTCSLCKAYATSVQPYGAGAKSGKNDWTRTLWVT